MAEVYSFFDPVLLPSGLPDRDYNAQEFTDYFGDLVTTGLMKGVGAELKVTANGSNMVVEIDTGTAFVEDKRYANTAKLAHTLDTETLGKDRIDRIVIRKDLNTDARWVKSFIKKGVASANPVPPTLTRNEMVYEISLAQIKVIGGQTYINAADVVNERGKPDVCPWAGSNVLPTFDDSDLENLINNVNNHISNNLIHITNAERLRWNNTMNAINIGSNTQDPNLVSESFIMTKHPNAPDNVVYWYILTFFYGSKESSKGQMAISYNGEPRMFIRYWLTGSWTKWKEVTQYSTNWMSLPEGPEWATPGGGFLQVRREGQTVYFRGYVLNSGLPSGILTTLPAEFRPRNRSYILSNKGTSFFVLPTGDVFGSGVENGGIYGFDSAFSANV